MKKALFLTLFASLLFVAGAAGQDSQAVRQIPDHIGLPIDWSTRHIVHSDRIDDEFAAKAMQEPRIMFSWLQRYNAAKANGFKVAASGAGRNRLAPRKSAPMTRDWNFTLGSGTVSPNMYPAKFGFDVTAAASCTNDYAIFGLNVPGVTSGGAGTAQPNLVGFNNLYSGTGTAITIAAPASGAVEAGNTVTITTSAAHGFVTGDTVYISGVGDRHYNGLYTITVTSATKFTYTSPYSGLGNSGNGSVGKVSGICSTGVPTVEWAYNVSTAGGAIVTSPTLSFAGDKVAFIESKVSSATITAAAEVSTTVTITAVNTFSPGDTVIISGVSPAGYNGTFTIATATGANFTYTANLTGLGAGTGGTASVAKGGAIFSVLTLGTSGDNGSFDLLNNVYHVVTAGGGTVPNNATLLSTAYTASGNTRSAPYVIYEKDMAFFGDDNGTMYRTSCVFSCSSAPTVTAINTSVGAVKMASPIVDDYSSKLFVGGSDGKLYSISNPDTCTAPCATSNVVTVGANTANGGIYDSPLVDSTFQTVVVTAGDNVSGKDTFAQYNESLTLLNSFAPGNSAFPIVNGQYTDEYYNNTIGSPTVSGFGYFCGNNNSGQAAIFTITMAGGTNTIAASPSGAVDAAGTVTITTTAAHGMTAANIGQQVKIAGVGVAGYNGTFTITAVPTANTFQYTAAAGLAGSGGGTVTKPLTTSNPPVFASSTNQAIAGANKSTCSPYAVFTAGGTERLFFSSPSIPKNSCQTNNPSTTDGCLFAFPVTTGTGVLGTVTTASEHGGTSAIIIDNSSASAQASSLYFANQGQAGDAVATTCNYTTSNTASYCAVKLTQSGLQ